MDVQNISFLVALGAGFFSFVSPCILPLVPVYIGFLSGKSADEEVGKKTIFLHALFFVLGFSLIFIGLGASVGLAGNFLINKLPVLRIIAGAILVIFGIHFLGIFKIPLLYRVKKLDFASKLKKSYWTSFLVGVSFSLGWTPCVGPILGGILVLAYASHTVLRGVLLLTAYSMGLGIPFLVIALCLSQISGFLKRINKYYRLIEIISGALLIVIGVLIATDSLRILNF